MSDLLLRHHLLPGEEARALRPGEEDTFLQVLCAAFGLNAEAARPLFRADPFFDLSHKRALWTADGQMASVLTVIPCNLRVGGSVVPVGGIAGVATRADRRGQGCASRLLGATIAACDAELPYSALALFAVQRDFYRHRGWADASRLWTATFPAGGVPQGGVGVKIEGRLATPADRLVLHALHARLTENRTGACVRDSRRWHIIETLAPARQTRVFTDNNAVRGYALIDRIDDTGDAYRVVELLVEGENACRAARALLDSPPFPVSRWEWPALPSDFAALGLPTDTLTPEPGMMLKLCSPARALALRHADGYRPHLAGGRSLSIQTDSESLLLNERGVHVGPDGGDCISCDSRTLAQLFVGYYGAGEAAQLGLLTASSSDALSLAEQWFPALNPCVLPADQF